MRVSRENLEVNMCSAAQNQNRLEVAGAQRLLLDWPSAFPVSFAKLRRHWAAAPGRIRPVDENTDENT